jgi:hypothetical protein
MSSLLQANPGVENVICAAKCIILPLDSSFVQRIFHTSNQTIIENEHSHPKAVPQPQLDSREDRYRAESLLEHQVRTVLAACTPHESQRAIAPSYPQPIPTDPPSPRRPPPSHSRRAPPPGPDRRAARRPAARRRRRRQMRIMRVASKFERDRAVQDAGLQVRPPRAAGPRGGRPHRYAPLRTPSSRLHALSGEGLPRNSMCVHKY